MLSLKSSNSSSSTKYRKKKFTSVRDTLKLWLDFTDGRTVYNDDMTTRAAHNDTIYAVSNKAFDRRFGDEHHSNLGAAVKQTAASKRPQFRKDAAVGGHTYVSFDDNDESFKATKSIGNIETNLLSSSALHSQNLTVFFVVEQDSATPGGTTILHFNAHVLSDGSADPINFGTEADHNYQVWASDQSDKSGAVLTDSNIQATTNKELWTVKLTSSGSSYFYRNGDPTDGVTNGASKNHVYFLGANSDDNQINIGGGVGAFGGKMYEILVYTESLTNPHLKQVERLLKQKYKL